jgi:histidinol phosphatase-like PHP family hydrolase
MHPLVEMAKKSQPTRRVSNAEISELLAKAAEEAKFPLSRALRRASRKAFLWPVEVADAVDKGRSLTELPGVGPSLEKMIKRWIDAPPQVTQIPEIRRDFFTLTQARSVLAEKPEWARNLKGDLQMHTTWSDGHGTVREMAEAAEARGYQFIAITDHSKGLKIAGGINEEQLRAQADEIAKVNGEFATSRSKLRVLRSIELNISPSGGGDMDPAALRELDLVLGCFHSSLRTKEDQTARYVAALQNPSIHILGHPRGRIYNFRHGLYADWQRVFATAAKLGKAVEIDCYPDRQDLSLDLVRMAKKEGCWISMGTDSHHPVDLGAIELGLASALAADVPRNRILNFMERAKLLAWAAELRESHAKAS